MADGFAELDAWIKRVETLPTKMVTDAAPDVAEALRVEIEHSIADGMAPDGEPWKLTKKGTEPLRNAAAHLFVAGVGTSIVVRLKGVEARHNSGTARGKIVRRILPNRKFSAPIVAAIKRVLGEHFKEHMGGE